jgi:hypothetical protein
VNALVLETLEVGETLGHGGILSMATADVAG